MPSRKPRYLIDFLLPALNGERFKGRLFWINKEEMTFCVLFQHKGKHTWTPEHSAHFVAWDELNFKYGLKHRKPELASAEYYTDSRHRAKVALKKLILCGEIAPIQPHQGCPQQARCFRIRGDALLSIGPSAGPDAEIPVVDGSVKPLLQSPCPLSREKYHPTPLIIASPLPPNYKCPSKADNNEGWLILDEAKKLKFHCKGLENFSKTLTKKPLFLIHYLIPALDGEWFRNLLCWLDKKEQIFLVDFKRKGKQEWSPQHSAHFIGWDIINYRFGLKHRQPDLQKLDYYSEARNRVKSAIQKLVGDGSIVPCTYNDLPPQTKCFKLISTGCFSNQSIAKLSPLQTADVALPLEPECQLVISSPKGVEDPQRKRIRMTLPTSIELRLVLPPDHKKSVMEGSLVMDEAGKLCFKCQDMDALFKVNYEVRSTGGNS